ncbi:hypothetical protein P7228_04635 [Altererythrobacter arenosus]|uniref:DUF4440 domain-containing protein n=1 Tax=Altererythrobacter arenosus TaxID=3032592 RepID=A0ABY8FTM6_9SPHN|nr:hypothetical protein [Altererythrobacter sp. CAU 1644]WFL78354.1 hypothetical protein P7228_04635 [Altererythrobacter sp. CAU 1644]
MKKAAIAALTVLLAACASSQQPRTPDRVINLALAGAPGQAQPSKVVATELAFARMAREEGTWTAFREYATKDAVMPAPNFRNVHEVLKDRADPAEPIVWEPDMVWVSCNAQYALSTGPADYPGGARGRFATIWQLQKDGEYRWVVDQGFELDEGYAKPEWITADVAQCSATRPSTAAPATFADHSQGRSADGTLVWRTEIAADCGRTFVVEVLRDGAMAEVFRREAAAPPVPQGREPIACIPQ